MSSLFLTNLTLYSRPEENTSRNNSLSWV